VLLFTGLLIIAYLLGSIPSAVIVCKCLKLPDPRLVGSHNPGTTNVLRIGGAKIASLVLLADVTKGFLPVLLASLLHVQGAGWIGVAAVLGHLFPLLSPLQGGKGVATGLGASIALSPPLAGVIVAVWATVVGVSRYSSLAALAAAVTAPIAGLWLLPSAVLPLLVIALLLIWRHYANIQRLLTHTESKLW
jgi:glycerol-3-phosphate acyltransferase PlsY